MTRTAALVALALLVPGCVGTPSAPHGPFGRPKREPPPPYGVGPTARPVGNQSPLGIASAEPTPPPPPDERSLIPPKPDALVPAAGAPSGAAKNLADLKALVAAAEAAWRGTDTYEATFTRRELSPSGDATNEVLTYQFRREPMSLYTKNVGGGGRGRETLYYPARHGDKIYLVVGQGDTLLAKAGTVAPPMSPDSPRVTEKARYSIRLAGFCRPIGALTAAVAKLEAGALPPDVLTFAGPVRRDEYPYPLTGVTHRLRPGDDPLLPSGGTRLYFFDTKPDSPSYGMPVLVTAADAAGREVEYYLFDRMRSPAGLTDLDFDPSRLGKKK
jgi:hypothetical protein